LSNTISERKDKHEESLFILSAERETNSQSAYPIVNLLKIAKSHGSRKQCLKSWATQANFCQLIP